MRFSSSVSNLRDAVKLAQLAVPSSTARPEYAGVLLVVGATSCSAIGSRNGETTIAAHVTVESNEPGRAMLPAGPLSALLATFAPDDRVGVSLDGSTVVVAVTGYTPYHLRVLDSEFPLPTPPTAAAAPVHFERFPAALAVVRGAVNRTTNAVQLVSSSAGLALHATDSYRLARCVLPEAGFGDATIVLPLDALEWIARVQVDQVTFDPATRAVRFAGPEGVVSTRLLASAFPVITTLLNHVPPHRVTFAATDLLGALSRLRALARQAPMVWRIDGESMVISASSPEFGWGEERVPLSVNTGPGVEFHARPDFFADAVHSLNAPAVQLAWSAPLEPLYLSSDDPISATMLVTPVRAPQ